MEIRNLLASDANKVFPFFPGKVVRIHQNFPYPAKATGSAEEVMDEFQREHDLIKTYMTDFVNQYITNKQ